MFDLWLLKLDKLLQKLWRIEDYASNAIFLWIAPSDTVQKLIALEEWKSEAIAIGTGNISVTVVYLVFMRIRPYDLNASNINWKDRAIYCWATLCGSLLSIPEVAQWWRTSKKCCWKRWRFCFWWQDTTSHRPGEQHQSVMNIDMACGELFSRN